MTDRSSIVDLRSDTVTQPTPAMREAMMAAPLGDDVFGTDPSVNALQEKIAALLGFEAALFVPTGTQSNLCAILSHCGRGDEYIVGQQAHCYRWEGGGAAVFGSVQPQPLDHAPDGTLPLAQIEATIKPDDAHFARTRMLALENTLGGKLLPFDYVQAATDLAKGKGLQRHLDGARLFNAATAQAALNKRSDIRTEARRIAQNVRFTGGIPEAEKDRLIGESKIGLSLSFEEGWGLSINEFLAAAIPVVAYALPIFDTVFPNQLYGVKVGDIDGAAANILRLLDRDAERKEVGQRGRSFVMQYDYRNVAKSELKLLERLF